MAAKLLHSLADDNPDLQKQIGCMNGIFNIFDRQHMISGRRPNHRRLLPPPPGIQLFLFGGVFTGILAFVFILTVLLLVYLLLCGIIKCINLPCI